MCGRMVMGSMWCITDHISMGLTMADTNKQSTVTTLDEELCHIKLIATDSFVICHLQTLIYTNCIDLEVHCNCAVHANAQSWTTAYHCHYPVLSSLYHQALLPLLPRVGHCPHAGQESMKEGSR